MKIVCFSAVVSIFIFITSSASCQWKQLADSAKVLNEQKRYDKAVDFYVKAREALKEDSTNTGTYATVSNMLAELYTNIGRYKDAEELYTESMQLTEKRLGKDNAEYATICNNFGRLCRLTGKFEKAAHLYIEGKNIRERVLGKENPVYAASCNALGNLYLGTGDYQKAELLYVEAKQIREKSLGKLHPDYAASCNNLGLLYDNTGQYKKAESFCLEAKEIREKVLGKQHPDYVQSCNNLGMLYRHTGLYGKAEPLLLEAKELWEKAFGKERPDYAQICTNIAALYSAIGQYSKAESFCLEAKQIREKVLGKQHPDYVQSCNNLAIVYVSMGQYKKAESLNWEARRISEEKFGKENALYTASCSGLAIVYSYTQQYAKAEPLFIEVKRIREQLLGNDHPVYAQDCHNLAFMYVSMGLYKMAEPLYLEAKQISEKVFGKEHPDYTQYCLHLANLYWSVKKPEKATAYYTEAIRSQNTQVKEVFQFASEAEKQSYLKNLPDIESYFFSFAMSSHSQYLQALSYDVALFNRNLVLSSSKQIRSIINSSNDTAVQHKYNKWINLREQLSYWYLKSRAERSAPVKDIEVQASTLEKELTLFSSAFQKQKAETDITWQTIRQHLNVKEAAIEFVTFHLYNGIRSTDSIYYAALLLTKNHTEPLFIPLFESRQLEKLIHKGNSFLTVTTLYQGSNKANPVYNLIWKPIEEKLSGINKIYFASAGLLHRISFQAIPINNRQVLSSKYELVQLNTTSSIVDQPDNSIDESDIFYLYGGIKYEVDSLALKQAVLAYHYGNNSTSAVPDVMMRGNPWDYLPGTEKEINQIKALGERKKFSVVSFTGIAACEERIKALSGRSSPSVLHIATHGFFYADPEEKKYHNVRSEFALVNVFKQAGDPLLRSGLLFAGANNAWKGKQVKGIEDGILTAFEASNLYLPNTKLVVLSACETGLGDIKKNEGVYGLQRAFKIAGVKNLLMSLWKVPDEETAEFMQLFYKNIFERQPIATAFNNAQTEMKNKYSNEPYRWAAWILVK